MPNSEPRRTPDPAWWRDGAAVHRFVCDVVADELARIWPGRSFRRPPWPESLRLDEAGLGADSLDRLKLATALGEAIHLQRSGSDDALLGQTTIGEWIQTAARSLAGFSSELTFRTSGSTGQPKWSVHALADLEAEITVLAVRFSGCRRIISTVPSHHIYGFLFTILLPFRLDADVLDVRASSPAGLATVLAPGDLVIGYPDFWAAFGRAFSTVGSGTRVGRGIRGVSSTAPCPLEVARAVTAAGIESLVEVYGSSETAGIGWRDDPAAAYDLFPYWRRGSDDATLVRRLPDGTDRSVPVPDRLLWTSDRRIRPAGRHEGAVQIGGHNVFPDRVRDVLRRYPAVADAAVRLMDPDEGDRLKAFVVPTDPSADRARLRQALWSWLDGQLTPPERPRSIDFGPALPVGALGKSADWRIAMPESFDASGASPPKHERD